MSTTEPAGPDPEGTRLAELLGSALGGPVIDAEATGEAGLGDDPSRDLTTGPDGSRGHVTASWRERAEAAEAERDRLFVEITAVRALALTNGISLADLERMHDAAHTGKDGSEEGGDGYDRDFAGPVL